MKKILFVAFSHTLTEAQKEGWDSIVTLAEVAPELQTRFSQVPATATLHEIQELACDVVRVAQKAKATHFFCVGEPTLCTWANLYAADIYTHRDGDVTAAEMTCVQSTTERVSVETTQPDGTVVKTAVFKHVQWREFL